MSKKRVNIFNYWVPALALFVVLIQLFMSSTWNLTKWKGGGFGMYSEVHYYYHDVFISPLSVSLDSLQKKDVNITDALKKAKRMPSDANLKRIGELVSKYAPGDTISIQIWKPHIDSRNAKYSRELINQVTIIKKL